MKNLMRLAGALIAVAAAAVPAQDKPAAPPAKAAAPKADPPKADAAKADAPKADAGPKLDTPACKAGYSLGYNIGRQVAGAGIASTDLDLQAYVKGLQDGMDGEDAKLTDDEMKSIVQTLMAAQQRNRGARNLAAGKEYLAKNKAKPGVVETASGLQYLVLTAGTGAKPAATDRVRVHYRGTLITGKEFDSSYRRGEPAEFPLNGVIRGWTEVVQLMPVGSKYRVVIPANLAYGDRGQGPDIGPNSTLVFEIELLDILR